MLKGKDIIYLYDGTFDGLMCCVFEAFNNHEQPYNIIEYSKYEPTLYECKDIKTNKAISNRVQKGIKEKISPAAFWSILKVYYTDCINKEILILNFIVKGFKYGRKITYMHNDPDVNALQKSLISLSREIDHYLGFIRFSQYESSLISIIEPKNFVLPFISHHFCNRLVNENFLIYDKTHKVALIYSDFKADIVYVDDLKLPKISEDEEIYANLWRLFYNTISIKERENPRCIMTHMPKRFWEHITEVNNEKSLLLK